jgi:hypothetical protein
MGSCSLQRYSELIRSLLLLFVINRIITISHIFLLRSPIFFVAVVNSLCLFLCLFCIRLSLFPPLFFNSMFQFYPSQSPIISSSFLIPLFLSLRVSFSVLYISSLSFSSFASNLFTFIIINIPFLPVLSIFLYLCLPSFRFFFIIIFVLQLYLHHFGSSFCAFLCFFNSYFFALLSQLRQTS